MNLWQRITGRKSMTGSLWGGVIAGPGSAEADPAQIRQNSIVGACMRFIIDSTIEAPLRVQKMKSKGGKVDWEFVDHKIDAILTDPFAFYKDAPYKQDYSRWMSGVAWSDHTDGNTYCYVLRSASGQLVGWQYLPQGSVSMVRGAGGVIQHYVIRLTAGTTKVVPIEDMFHIARGIDPVDPALGLSPLKSAMRHILTDNEIAQYCHSIMQSPSVGGLISTDVKVDEPTKKGILQRIKAMTSGAQAGNWLFLSGGNFKIDRMRFNPDEMAIDTLSDLPEERTCAALGVPPIVAQLGSGLEHATYSNYKEARASAYQSCIVPSWTRISASITTHLRNENVLQPDERVVFDTRCVAALQDDKDALHARVQRDFAANLIDRAEARRQLGFEARPEDEGVYNSDLTNPLRGMGLNGKSVRAQVEANV